MENILSGEGLSLDLVFLDGKAVLHIVNSANPFPAETFLDSRGETYGHFANGTWLTFVQT